MKSFFSKFVCLFSVWLIMGIAVFAQTAPTQPKRSYDDITRDFGKQAQAGIDTLYRQVGKAAQVAQQAASKIDVSQVGNGKVVVQNDTIDFGTPAAKLYESLKGLVIGSEPPKSK